MATSLAAIGIGVHAVNRISDCAWDFGDRTRIGIASLLMIVGLGAAIARLRMMPMQRTITLVILGLAVSAGFVVVFAWLSWAGKWSGCSS